MLSGLDCVWVVLISFDLFWSLSWFLFMIKPFCNCWRIIRNLFSQLLLYLFIGSLRKFFLFFNFNNFRFFNSLNWIALTLKFTFPTKFQSRIKIFPKPFSIIARILHHSIEPIGRMMSMIKMKFTCNKV